MTGPSLSRRPALPGAAPRAPGPNLEIVGARAHNLEDIDVAFPSGALTAVTGVSGSGKTSLVFDVLLASAGRAAGLVRRHPRPRAFLQVVAAGTEAPAESASSIPLTYLGLFDGVRGLFASTDEARARGFKKAHFSFLTPEGRCEACGGSGRKTVSLDHLADVAVPCEVCRGARYDRDVLEVRSRDGRSPMSSA